MYEERLHEKVCPIDSYYTSNNDYNSNLARRALPSYL